MVIQSTPDYVAIDYPLCILPTHDFLLVLYIVTHFHKHEDMWTKLRSFSSLKQPEMGLGKGWEKEGWSKRNKKRHYRLFVKIKVNCIIMCEKQLCNLWHAVRI